MIERLGDQRASAPKNPGLLTCATGELVGQVKSLIEIHQRLGSLADRILGSQPEAPMTNGGNKDLTPSNSMDNLRSNIMEVSRLTSSIRDLVNRLEEL